MDAETIVARGDDGGCTGGVKIPRPSGRCAVRVEFASVINLGWTFTNSITGRWNVNNV